MEALVVCADLTANALLKIRMLLCCILPNGGTFPISSCTPIYTGVASTFQIPLKKGLGHSLFFLKDPPFFQRAFSFVPHEAENKETLSLDTLY